jgi:hypothetical protein
MNLFRACPSIHNQDEQVQFIVEHTYSKNNYFHYILVTRPGMLQDAYHSCAVHSTVLYKVVLYMKINTPAYSRIPLFFVEIMFHFVDSSFGRRKTWSFVQCQHSTITLDILVPIHDATIAPLGCVEL